MHSLFADLSLGAQTSYAELLDMARGVELAKFSSLRGSFHHRQIKGKTYIYFNFRDVAGHGRSVYVGPEGEGLALGSSCASFRLGEKSPIAHACASA
jgi:hypothetical protein